MGSLAAISDSVFKAGGTLPADHPTYIERTADHELRQALLDGEFCYVLDSRQVGKSSLMVRTNAYLRQQGVRVAQIDLTGIGSNVNAEQWYGSMLRRIGDGLGQRRELLQFWSENEALGVLERLFLALEQVAVHAADSPLVIFVDEIDYVRNLNGFDTDEFFAKIREVYTRRAIQPALNRLTFCLLGSATPDALIRSVTATPFNIGRRFTLKDFTAEEARPFAGWLGENGKALLKRVLYWTNGHPFLTQRVCEALRAGASGRQTAPSVDATVERLFFGKSPYEGAHLQLIAKRLLEDADTGTELVTRLESYRQVRDQRRPHIREDATNSLHSILRLSGLVALRDGYLWIRNRVYFHAFDHSWIRNNMPVNFVVQKQKRRTRFVFLVMIWQIATVFCTLVIEKIFKDIFSFDFSKYSP